MGSRLGILGGGQLGRMLIQAAINYDLRIAVMDPDPDAPCSSLPGFVVGDLRDYDTVMRFGASCDVITIEIENVNAKALADLAAQGKKVFPQPGAIAMIQDKGLQKKFYTDHGIPTADFLFVENSEEVRRHADFLPAVNKLRREGYDGRGVTVIRGKSDLEKAFDAPGILERLVTIDKEIAVLVARNESGSVVTYPPIEMVFDPERHLVRYLFSPSDLPHQVLAQADSIAIQTIGQLLLVGVLAVEMFVTASGAVLVNEVAPRPHNSGHHTIEGNVTSQFDQHLRAIMNFPLGKTACLHPSAMINMLGEPGYTGLAVYQGLEKLLVMDRTYVHIYGKKITKPYRKMGHVTILADDAAQLREKAELVRRTFKVVA